MSVIDNNKSMPNALPAGYFFNEFEIKEVIGGGGFGIVYRAWDHQLEREIAIKEYMPSSLVLRREDLTLGLRGERFGRTFQAGLASFIQEARLLARFNHPNLLHVLRFWEQNGTAYMGTQFYSGTTLKDLQTTHPHRINEAWIRHLLPPLFGAINTIHQAGYMHCDISLDNIQIQETQLPVLLDFGSARKAIGNLSDETEVMLKPGFAPIEQYTENNEDDQGPWTDIYALGAVLHTLIIGTPPPISVVRSIEDSYQPLEQRCPSGYSLQLLRAIDRSLALKPEERPQTIDELAALIAFSVPDAQVVVTPAAVVATESQPLPPHPASKGPENRVPPAQTSKTPPDRRARPVLILVSIAAIIAIASVLGFNYLQQDQVATVSSADNSTLTASVTPPPAAVPTLAPESTAAASVPAVTTPPTTTVTPVTTITPVTPPPPPVAQVYMKLAPGEQVKVNGQEQSVTRIDNRSALLQLALGQYQIEILNQNQTRQQVLNIDRAGTWLINPSY